MSGKAVALFKAQTAVDAMTSVSYHMAHVRSHHTVQSVYIEDSGNLSALVLVLEGTLDNRGVTDANATWVILATNTWDGTAITALASTFVVVSQPFKRVRVRVTTLTGEGSGDTLTTKYIQGAI